MKVTKRTLSIESGSEGPRHDPYGYTSYIYEDNSDTIELHLGLDEMMTLNGMVLYRLSEDGENVPTQKFELMTSLTLEQFTKAYERITSYCLTCGNRKSWDFISGFPGETLIICGRCGQIVDSQVDHSALI